MTECSKIKRPLQQSSRSTSRKDPPVDILKEDPIEDSQPEKNFVVQKQIK